jgi:uncharacterized membrane protein
LARRNLLRGMSPQLFRWQFYKAIGGMSATLIHPGIGRAPAASPLRFGRESASSEASVQWVLKRNCSITPRQTLWFFGSLCLLSLAIGGFFWLQGATLVLPFAWIELLAVAAALFIYTRHATDSEHIELQPGRLIVEHACGRSVERVEFVASWVRVEPESGDRSLIELSGQGLRIRVGRFVRPELRRQLAEELRWALRRSQSRSPL